MSERPTQIPMPPLVHATSATPPLSSPQSGTSSPRIQHMPGQPAPEMSPLDIFQARSRALARQLEESQKSNRRVSRLPPIAVADGLGRKPTYTGTGSPQVSTGSQGREKEESSPESATGNKLAIESPAFRPQSFYPKLSKMAASPDSQEYRKSSNNSDEIFSTPSEYASPPNDYFGVPRAPSPEQIAPLRPSLETQNSYRSKNSFDSSRRSELERGLSVESSSSRMSQHSNANGLLPPNPPYARKSPSIRSVTDSEDENPGITPSSSFTQQRTMSNSSGFSLPQSPQLTPGNNPYNRPPSQCSEYSVNGNRKSRPAFNFSRPMSRNSRPSMENSSRMSSAERVPERGPRIYNEEELQTPSSVDMVNPMEAEDLAGPKDQETPGAPSYIYAKYSLPRGRMLQRDSIPLDGLTPTFEWEQPPVKSNVSQIQDAAAASTASLPTPPHSIESDGPPRNSLDFAPTRPPPIPPSENMHRRSMTSMNTNNSGSTIKASQQHNRGPSTDLTAEDHLAKGIECHERGSVNESTYHLRLAARQNNPTAMLLYALACRHGWGMRPNPTEGVKWLRKAMDCASIELTADTGNGEGPDACSGGGGGRPGDAEGRRTRKAQFALSVYELGVSHMNGWGIEQDKALALRCFEIAGSWGDADAMAEAGFCYAQGVGCKKDLRKAARYYRSAEARGMSMVGNSWIHKSKYDEKDDGGERVGRSAKAQPAEKKPREKSRTRTLFGRKKSVAS